ncbi:flagellar hook-length control protein FliK [Paracoccus kondratievae]
MNYNTSNQEYIIISGSPDRKIPLTYRSPYLHANHIAQALAYSASNPAEGVIEIILTPEDLGPMKIILTPGEKMHVSVFAEQHETYQLLKRNSGILEEELRQSGLEKADVSFSNNGKNSQSGEAFQNPRETLRMSQRHRPGKRHRCCQEQVET